MKSDSLEKLKKYLESPEGKQHAEEYFQEVARKREIRERRISRVDEYLKTVDFKSILTRIKEEHNDESREKIWKKGIIPYPNNKACLLFDWIEHSFEVVNVPQLNDMFVVAIYFVKGFYFQVAQGQGETVWSVYDGEMNKFMTI